MRSQCICLNGDQYSPSNQKILDGFSKKWWKTFHCETFTTDCNTYIYEQTVQPMNIRNMKKKDTKELPIVLVIRAALLCAILFEFVQMYQASVNDFTDTSTRKIIAHSSTKEDEVLNTHLSLNNINVEELSVNANAAFVIHSDNKDAKKKNRFMEGWRKKVTYTTKGIIVEGGISDIIKNRMRARNTASSNLIEMSKVHIEPEANVSVAICFKTLFGEIDLGIVLQWAAYNRLLGFDHIFMWYRPEMMNNTRFEELKSLPYVTLTENTGGRRDNYYRQWWTEETCNRDDQFAGKYDYALHADIDEYLWFPKQMGIKEFLMQNPNLNYLSFSKRMYTLDHQSAIDAPLTNHVIDMKQSIEFSVSKYPFYIENFCYATGNRRGDPFCPTWKGRAKVIVRPKKYVKIDTHGNIKEPDLAKGEIHFLPEQAHFKEWPYIFAKHNVTKRDPVDFEITTEDEVHIHNLERGFKANQRNSFDVKHDGELKEWFQFVIARFSKSSVLRRDTSKSS